jgi:uncharacterized repeat protein (TIGR03803 family)
MNRHGRRRICLGLVLIAVWTVAVAMMEAQARVLHSFQGGNDGAFPTSELIADKEGNLYGTTVYGGSGQCTDSAGFVIGCGTVFELVKPAVSGGEWKEEQLHSFQGDDWNRYDSGYPYAGLVMDAAGNIYGTTAGILPSSQSFYYDVGTVFELVRPTQVGGWGKKVLYRFRGQNDGANPMTHLVWDSAGRLYGTTSNGQGYNGGTVFRLTRGTKGWTEEVLYAFTGGTDGNGPNALLVGTNGHVYGTTSIGGGFGYGDQYFPHWTGGGLFFELREGRPGRMWAETQQYVFQTCEDVPGAGAFCGALGSQPLSSLAADSAGNLYGTTQVGGTYGCVGYKDSAPGCGVVYQLTPPSVAGGAWTQNVIYAFGSSQDGAFPMSGLVADREGNLYGTNIGGLLPSLAYTSSLGTVYKLSPPSGGTGAWTETILHVFAGGNDGAYAAGTLLFGTSGNAMYGTTQYGGTGNCIRTTTQPTGCGTVFSVAP